MCMRQDLQSFETGRGEGSNYSGTLWLLVPRPLGLSSRLGDRPCSLTLGIFREHALNLQEMNPVHAMLEKPRSAAIVGLILALPYLAMITVALLHIEPPVGPFGAVLLGPQGGQIGTLLLLGALGMAVAAFFVVRRPVMQ